MDFWSSPSAEVVVGWLAGGPPARPLIWLAGWPQHPRLKSIPHSMVKWTSGTAIFLRSLASRAITNADLLTNQQWHAATMLDDFREVGVHCIQPNTYGFLTVAQTTPLFRSTDSGRYSSVSNNSSDAISIIGFVIGGLWSDRSDKLKSHSNTSDRYRDSDGRGPESRRSGHRAHRYASPHSRQCQTDPEVLCGERQDPLLALLWVNWDDDDHEGSFEVDRPMSGRSSWQRPTDAIGHQC